MSKKKQTETMPSAEPRFTEPQYNRDDTLVYHEGLPLEALRSDVAQRLGVFILGAYATQIGVDYRELRSALMDEAAGDRWERAWDSYAPRGLDRNALLRLQWYCLWLCAHQGPEAAQYLLVRSAARRVA